MNDIAGLSILFIAILISALMGYTISNDNFEAQAIERGCAAYSPDKGEFTWK